MEEAVAATDVPLVEVATVAGVLTPPEATMVAGFANR